MKDQFSELVSKVLAGEAGDDEKKLLQQKLQESNEHASIYHQIKEYWDADVTPIAKRDKERFTDNLMSKLHLEQETGPSKFRKLYLRIASVAAILFFATTCSLFYLYNTSTSEHLYTYSAQATPTDYVLADGTKVKLNKNSSITFRSDYGSDRRDVQLQGEAFFKVTKDISKPFTVEAFGTKTEVLGTSFNVKAESGNVTTTLVEGAVRFMSYKCEEVLRPGDEISYNTTTRKYDRYATDTQFNTAWVSGRFNYNNVSFARLSDKLEQIYKLNIEITDKKIANHIVSASFLSEEPIEEILSALESELGFNYIIKDSTQIYIVSKTLRNNLPM